MTARSEEKATTAIGKIKAIDSTSQVEFLHLDLESLENVRTAAETFLRKEDRLDILICNAGVMTRDLELTRDGIAKDFQVNHLGNKFPFLFK
jgi:NAD(P)-dependent dehydrogenase (short-subunit alcohol dehydrogenase family)